MLSLVEVGFSIVARIISVTKDIVHFGGHRTCNNHNEHANLSSKVQKSKNLDSLQVPQWVCEVRDLANANTNDDKGKPFRRSRICTEQVVPTPANQQSPKREEMLSNLRKEVRGEDLRLRVLLLSPASEARAFGDPASVACGRSNISLASDTGSVTVEVIRLAGAAAHHFRLDVSARADSAHITLPPKFRGNIHIASSAAARSGAPVQVVCSPEVQRCMETGGVRVNPPQAAAAADDEDDVHIRAARHVELQIAAEAEELRCGNKQAWTLEKAGGHGPVGRRGLMFGRP